MKDIPIPILFPEHSTADPLNAFLKDSLGSDKLRIAQEGFKGRGVQALKNIPA